MYKNENVNGNQTMPIYFYKLAGYLQLRGFILIDCRANNKTNDGKLVYYFKKSPMLMDAIEEFTKARSNHEILQIQL